MAISGPTGTTYETVNPWPYKQGDTVSIFTTEGQLVGKYYNVTDDAVFISQPTLYIPRPITYTVYPTTNIIAPYYLPGPTYTYTDTKYPNICAVFKTSIISMKVVDIIQLKQYGYIPT